MRAFSTNIEDEAKMNGAYRRVLFTGRNMQVVVMCLEPGEDIGAEVHEDGDQLFFVEDGIAEVETATGILRLDEHSLIVIPAGMRHNVTNRSSYKELKLCTIYAPPEHPDGTVHRTKDEASEGRAVLV